MTWLAKHCKSIHNIRGGSGLLLGTLYKYHKIENPDIVDGQEGHFRYELDFPNPTKIDIDVFRTIFSGIFQIGPDGGSVLLPGKLDAQIRSLSIARTDVDGVIVQNTSMTIDRIFPDCFIWCMSLEDDIHAANRFDGYDDAWLIPLAAADTFASRLAMLLLQNSVPSDFAPELAKLHPGAAMTSLGAYVQHRSVTYKDRSVTIRSPRFTRQDFLSMFHDIPYIKPISYSFDREYRFVFQVGDFEAGHHNRVYQPAVSDVLLPSETLLDLVVP